MDHNEPQMVHYDLVYTGEVDKLVSELLACYFEGVHKL